MENNIIRDRINHMISSFIKRLGVSVVVIAVAIVGHAMLPKGTASLRLAGDILWMSAGVCIVCYWIGWWRRYSYCFKGKYRALLCDILLKGM